MEVTLNKLGIDCFKAVYSASFSREETAESVVPDVLPDIYQIIDTDGLIMLRSKEVEQGRVSLSGTIDVTVIYAPEGESCVKKLSLNMPFTVSVDAPGVSENSRAVCMLRVGSIDTRMLNPRKVLVRADISVELACYDEGELVLHDGILGECGQSIQVKTDSCAFSPVKAVREKTFVLSDEYQLPASKPPAGELVKKQIDLAVEDIKTVGNKLVFRGTANVSLMYTSLEDGELAACSFETSFSQILEMDSLGENTQAKVDLMITGAYFDMVPNAQEGRLISLELHVVAQGVCHDMVNVGYIADAYSNVWPLELAAEDVALTSIERQSSIRETVHETAETPEPVREVICVYPMAGTSSADCGKIRCSIMLCCIYRGESGNIGKVSKRFSVESSVELDADMELKVTRIACAEIYATVASGGVELRLPVDVDFTILKKTMLKSVSSITLDEENPLNNLSKPSLTVLYPGMGTDIWGLAKKYGSTPDLIAQANELPESGDILGQLLLIPRER